MNDGPQQADDPIEHGFKEGDPVWVEDGDGRETIYQIVGSEETDPTRGRISVMAPLARTLIGKKVGDAVSVPAPGGDRPLRRLGHRSADPPHLGASLRARTAETLESCSHSWSRSSPSARSTFGAQPVARPIAATFEA